MTRLKNTLGTAIAITVGTMLAVTTMATMSTVAPAQTYPSKPIRIVTPYGQGGNADILTRVIGEFIAKGLGQPVLVDNRPGGSSTIGSKIVAKAPADGHTLMLISSSHSVNPSLFSDLPYDTLRDFAAVSMVGATPILLVANPRVSANSIKELVALAKAKPGSLNFSTSGNGSPAHLAGELLNLLAGIKLTHVPYKTTAQAFNDVIGGTVELAFPSTSSVLPQIKSGKLKALGITSPKRSPLTPDIPAMAESVPGYQATIWTGVLAPGATPKPIITRLNTEIVKALNTPEIRTKLVSMGVEIEPSTPEEFAAFIEAEIKKWARVIKESGIKVEMER